MYYSVFIAEPNEDQEDVSIIYTNYMELIVTDIKDIYPKLSDKALNSIKQHYNEDYSIIKDKTSLSYEELIKNINDSINDKRYIVLNYYNQEIISDINKYVPKDSIIDISLLDSEEEHDFVFNYKYRDDLRFKDKYNRFSELSIDELKDTINIVDKIATNISKYDLSPLEKLIFVSDVIREKVYLDNEDDVAFSRDISKVLNGQYIVCSGYANLLASTCYALGIQCENAKWDSVNKGDSGHESNIVYINDDKYDVHQFFEVDLTPYSKGENDEYLNKYNFISSIGKANHMKQYNGFCSISETENKIARTDKAILRRKRLCELGAPDSIIDHENMLIISHILEVSDLIGNEELRKLYDNTNYEDKESIRNTIVEYKKLHNNEIEVNKLMEAIYNVKRIEHLIDPDKYKFDYNVIKTIHEGIINDPYRRKDDIDKLVNVIFKDEYLSSIATKVEGHKVDNPGEVVEKDIGRIKVLSLLKKELNNRQSKKS